MIKISPKFLKSKMLYRSNYLIKNFSMSNSHFILFPKREKNYFNSFSVSNRLSLKFDEEGSLKSYLDLYRSNTEFDENWFTSFIYCFSKLLENVSFDYITYFIEQNSETFESILNNFEIYCKTINSNEKLIAYSYFLYIIHIKSLPGSNRFGKYLNYYYLDYFEANYKDYNFFDRLSIITTNSFYQAANIEKYFEEDLYNIENLTMSELKIFLQRVLHFKKNNAMRERLIKLFIIPYTRMALECNLLNKLFSLNFLNEYAKFILFPGLQKDIDLILGTLIQDFEDLFLNKYTLEDLKLNWIPTFFQFVNEYEGQVDLQPLVDRVFEYIFANDMLCDLNMNHFTKFYQISKLKKEIKMQDKHFDTFLEYYKQYIDSHPNVYLKNKSMAIFILIDKFSYQDKTYIEFMSDKMINNIHTFNINHDSIISYKKVIKQFPDLYETAKNTILDNLYNLAISLSAIEFDGSRTKWSDILFTMCFYAEEPNSKTDAILDNFLQNIKSQNELRLINTMKSLFGNTDTQDILFISYRLKILKVLLKNLTKEKILNITNLSKYTELFLCLNTIKIPEDNIEIQNSLNKLFSYLYSHQLSELMNGVLMNIPSYIQKSSHVSNSLIISIMIISKHNLNNNHSSIKMKIQNQLIFVMLVILRYSKQDNSIDKQLLQTYFDYVDNILPKLAIDTKLDNITLNFEEVLDSLIVLNKWGLKCNILISKYEKLLSIHKENENKLTSEKYPNLRKLVSSDPHQILLEKLGTVSKLL